MFDVLPSVSDDVAADSSSQFPSFIEGKEFTVALPGNETSATFIQAHAGLVTRFLRNVGLNGQHRINERVSWMRGTRNLRVDITELAQDVREKCFAEIGEGGYDVSYRIF